MQEYFPCKYLFKQIVHPKMKMLSLFSFHLTEIITQVCLLQFYFFNCLHKKYLLVTISET